MIRQTAAALLLAGAAAAWAQEAGGPGRGGRREELFKMVDAYIVSNLQESLGLSDEQFVKILPLVKRLQTDRRGFVQRRHEILQEMRGLLESGRATEARVGELMRELRTSENAEPGVIRKDTEAIDAVLTPVQQAKLRILELQVEQKIRGLASRARPGPGVRRRDGPAGQEPER